MAKIKLHRLHKIKLHPNRWLIWSIAYALIIGIAMVGYMKVTDVNFETDQLPPPYFSSAKVYINEQQGFTLRYPAEWSLESQANSVEFSPSSISDAGASISVLKQSEQRSLVAGLNVISSQPIMVDGQAGTKIIAEPRSNELETVVTVNYNNKLYVIRGSNAAVNKLLMTFNFK